MPDAKQTPRVAFSDVGITVPDLDAAVKFYTEALGFYLIMGRPRSNMTTARSGRCATMCRRGMGLVPDRAYVDRDGIGIELFEFPRTEPEQARSSTATRALSHLRARSDLEGRIKKIEAAGGRQRMKQVRYYYPNEKPYRMIYRDLL